MDLVLTYYIRVRWIELAVLDGRESRGEKRAGLPFPSCASTPLPSSLVPTHNTEWLGWRERWLLAAAGGSLTAAILLPGVQGCGRLRCEGGRVTLNTSSGGGSNAGDHRAIPQTRQAHLGKLQKEIL